MYIKRRGQERVNGIDKLSLLPKVLLYKHSTIAVGVGTSKTPLGSASGMAFENYGRESGYPDAGGRSPSQVRLLTPGCPVTAPYRELADDQGPRPLMVGRVIIEQLAYKLQPYAAYYLNTD